MPPASEVDVALITAGDDQCAVRLLAPDRGPVLRERKSGQEPKGLWPSPWWRWPTPKAEPGGGGPNDRAVEESRREDQRPPAGGVGPHQPAGSGRPSRGSGRHGESRAANTAGHPHRPVRHPARTDEPHRLPSRRGNPAKPSAAQRQSWPTTCGAAAHEAFTHEVGRRGPRRGAVAGVRRRAGVLDPAYDARARPF